MSLLSPNIWTVTHFQTICLLFLCPDFYPHSGDEILPKSIFVIFRRCNMVTLCMNTEMLMWFTWRWSIRTETCSERIKENKEKIVGCDCGLYVYIHCMYCMSVLQGNMFHHISSYKWVRNSKNYACSVICNPFILDTRYLVKAIFLQDTWHGEVEWFLLIVLCNFASEVPVSSFVRRARDYHKQWAPTV
jgi:hypothetical protein